MGELILLLDDGMRLTPLMPVCVRYRKLLTPATIYHVHAIRGSTESRDFSIRRSGAPLIPRGDCYRIVEEVEKFSAPATPPMAAHLAGCLVERLEDREILGALAKAFASVFGAFPPDIGLEAIDALVRDVRRIPARFDVWRHCDSLMKERHYKKWVALFHLREHKRISLERRAARKQKLEWARHSSHRADLRIYNRWAGRFKHNIRLWQWLSSLPIWIAQCGEGEVEAWHDRIGRQPQLPADVFAELRKLRDAATMPKPNHLPTA